IKNLLKKNFNSIKICAVFTTVCFLISTLGANLYAIPMAENTNQKYEDIFNKASSISNEYGKITSSKDAQSDITVINIQDLHCHPQTQRNIAKIIGQISDKYNLKRVYVEGGYGDIDVSWLSSIKDENIRKQVIEKLLEDGILTGSEYYKLTNNNEVELKGIDEELLHRENIRRLSWIIDNQNKYRDVIKKVEREINVLEKIYVNGRNERFNGDIEDYISGKTDTKRFYRKLIKYVKDINANPDKYNNITAIRLQDYPNISKFMTLRKTSKNINVMDVTRQLQVVITELKSRLPYNVYTKLLKETENFSDSQKVVELISLLCEKEGIDLDNNYKALSEFLKSNELNRELNTVELVYEERQLITEIRKALSYNNEEYEITFVSDFSRYFKDYLEYKLTDADWKYFESGYEQFRQLYAKYASIDRIKEIENDFSEFNKYYEINDIRNEIFVDNLLQDGQPCTVEQSKLRQDEEILKQSKEVIIAVTGGFHSNALEDILQAKKVNTIVITPSIFEGIEKATKQYKGIIKEQSKQFQYQALAYKILSCAETPAQKAVMYGALKSLVGNNSARIREILGDVDLTELDNLLQNLQENAQIQNKISDITKILEIEAESLLNVLPKEGGKKILSPNIDKLLLDISEQLINMGIFLSDGVIFDIENSTLNGKDLKGIPVEVYSRMPDGMQKYLYEASVFEGDKTAPIWEEIVYRFIPALLFGSLILAATIFIPPISVLGLSLTLTDAVKMVAIGLFSYFQKTFIKAHVLTKQLEKKGQSTDAGFYKIWTDNDLTPNQKIEKTIEVIKNRIFVIFPNRSQKEEFDIFYERDKAAAEIKEGLTISTIFFTIPYVIAMLLFNLMPAGVTATIVSTILSYVTATIVSIILHYINNIAAKVIKDKGLLQKKKKDIDFKDIQRRIKNIKRHIENPQEKKYFPEIKEGSFLFKFGLENKDKRIKEYLMDFDKIRMSFIYRLEKEVIDTKAEIENLRNKETISKEDRDRIRTLKEKLETIEPEYMQIRSELGHDDIQKADATIKKIDELLPVFEEIEIILNMIEKFKYENSDANDEIGILERDFLDFVEHTFTKELMSLYDTKVTGIHVDRTVGFSTFLGKAMPFNNNVRKIYRLMLSSMLHDIGKNLVPGTILNKQGSFDELERDIMELHVVFGGHILRSSILRRLSYTAENHHRYTFETKVEEFLKRAKEEGRTEFLYSRTFPSIHEEKVTLIENIIDFLEKLNPELFFDSDEDQYQYPKSLNDIERILENIKIKLTVSQQELIDSWLQEIEQIEDEILISKIVGLADVFEAVSPKLSFDSERTYQFSRRIKDISKILEDIDMNVKLTESQNKERIILLSEIAQIDSENDAIKKQAMERNFIKKVLYDHSRSAVIKYIRETNYEQVRKNAFKIIFTKYPKDIFKELGKSEDEFMNDFKDNPKETVDKCMSLVDSSVFEFDTEVIKAFLEFYFRGEDISVNNAIAARLNNKRKNRFIIYMENLAYSLHKIFVNVNRILVRFVPIIASVFSEEETAHSVSAPSLSAKGKMSARKKRKERRDKEQTTQYRLVSGQNTEEFLMGLVHNNAYSYTKLTDIVNEYDIDLSSEAELINVLAENIYYPKETLYEIIRFARKYSINTDFQFEILLTHISVFDNLDAIDNLFSLDDTNIHLLDDIYYGAKDVYKQNLEGLEILLLDIDNLNEKLNGFRSLYFDKFNLSLNDIDMDKFTLFIEQFDKIKNLSKQDFQKLLSLDYAAINFILTAVSTGEEITKIFKYADEFNLSPKTFDVKLNKKDFEDVRYKAVIQYIDLGDEKFFKKLFSLDKQTLRIVVDSVPDSEFIKEYLFNEDKYCGNKTYFEVYSEFLSKIKDLNYRNIAVENNYLALKLLVNEGFNDIVSTQKMKDLIGTDNIISKYFIAIFVSRFIYDSLQYEVFNYDISSQDFQDRLTLIMDIYAELLNEMKEISIFSKVTKVYVVCNNEILPNGIRRFDARVFNRILGYFQDVPNVTNFDRAENENANRDWLDSFRKFGLDSDNPMNEKGYFVFMGHGGTIHLQSVSPRYDKIFKGKIIKSDLNSKSEFITVEELSDALFELAVRDYKKVDLRNITIDLSSCHSYEFARTVYDLLDKKYSEYTQTHEDFNGTYPTIITATGLETELTYTVFTQTINNFHDAVINTLRNGKIEEYTLDMLATSEFQIHESNITMFASYRNSEFKKNIKDVRNSVRYLFEKDKETEVKVKEKALEDISPLTADVLEASILKPVKSKLKSLESKLADYAHIWEELVFRTAPTAVSVIISSIIISLPFSPFITIPLGIITLGIYYKQVFVPYQEKFINAHIITDWLASKDAGDYTLSDVLKMAILGKFPSEELKQEYEKYYELE
ncbi:MAG: hypothetical protein IKO48_06125, partial [Elusimicrobia bacterium]|nr:hypothetical protein [Elusimicrobiota bacterium]